MVADGEIRDRELAAFLSDRKRSRYLDPYLAAESSVADAASLLGVNPQRMHYWTHRLLDLGLIRQSGVRKEARHQVRIYRSVADAFHVPLELLPTDDVETLTLHFDPVWQSFLRSVAAAARRYSPGWDVRYSRVGGQAAFHLVPSSPPGPGTRPSFTNSWARLRLTGQQARDLGDELERLLQHYLDQPETEQSRHFIAHVALVEDAGAD